MISQSKKGAFTTWPTGTFPHCKIFHFLCNCPERKGLDPTINDRRLYVLSQQTYREVHEVDSTVDSTVLVRSGPLALSQVIRAHAILHARASSHAPQSMKKSSHQLCPSKSGPIFCSITQAD